MKRVMALVLSSMLILGGCATKTKDDMNKTGDKGSTTQNGVQLTVVASPYSEKDANIVRDQLKKEGFDVKINLQPDYSSFASQVEAGNYDLAMSGWTTVTGNPDYAVRALFTTGGDSNKNKLSDSEIDKLIDKAATETPEEYKETYKQFEKRLVEEKAYIAPIGVNLKTQGLNKEVLNPESVRLSKSRSMDWEDIDFNDQSKRKTQPLLLQQTSSSLTSLDPIKGNDGSINMLNTNMYVRLVNLTDDDKVTADGSLSRNYAIAEKNSDFYFILRDDINFAKVKDKKAIDSGELVGAEDVVFSLNRAKDKKSVPNHKTYSLHEKMKDIQIVKDLSELENTKVSGTDKTIKAALEKNLEKPIAELVDKKQNVDNSNGKYQVVKITTIDAFPQVLNYLAHQSAGIVSKNQVESINTYDVSKYDVKKDISYGDQSTVTEGDTYNNTLAASGPYILLYKNDYKAVFQKNPAYMKGTDQEPKIENIEVKFIKDPDSSLSALRSGEIHVLYSVPENKLDLVKNDKKLKLQEIKGNGVSYVLFNLNENKPTANEDLRKAILYSINQDEIEAVYKGAKFRTYSTVTPLVDTGNELKSDPKKAQEHLKKYLESKK